MSSRNQTLSAAGPLHRVEPAHPFIVLTRAPSEQSDQQRVHTLRTPRRQHVLAALPLTHKQSPLISRPPVPPLGGCGFVHIRRGLGRYSRVCARLTESLRSDIEQGEDGPHDVIPFCYRNRAEPRSDNVAEVAGLVLAFEQTGLFVLK